MKVRLITTKMQQKLLHSIRASSGEKDTFNNAGETKKGLTIYKSFDYFYFNHRHFGTF